MDPANHGPLARCSAWRRRSRRSPDPDAGDRLRAMRSIYGHAPAQRHRPQV